MAMSTAQFSGIRLSAPSRATVRSSAAQPVQASLRQEVSRVAKAAGVTVISLGMALSANAVTVKLGTDQGGLVFEPESVTIKAGESVTWVNNAGFPHNIVFDEDEIPSGENADKLSHEDYLNAKGETVESTFKTAGTYTYNCEPHMGAGMSGKVIVQ